MHIPFVMAPRFATFAAMVGFAAAAAVVGGDTPADGNTCPAMPLRPGDVMDLSCITCGIRGVVEAVNPCDPNLTYRYRIVGPNGLTGSSAWAPADFRARWCSVACSPCLEFGAGAEVLVQSAFPWIPWTATRAVITHVDIGTDCAFPYRVVEVGPGVGPGVGPSVAVGVAVGAASWMPLRNRTYVGDAGETGWIRGQDAIERVLPGAPSIHAYRLPPWLNAPVPLDVLGALAGVGVVLLGLTAPSVSRAARVVAETGLVADVLFAWLNLPRTLCGCAHWVAAVVLVDVCVSLLAAMVVKRWR
jgi:hypothetical protein